jgi:hypothetical protein
LIKNLSVFIDPPNNSLEKTVRAFIAVPALLALIFLLELGFLPDSSLAQQGFKLGRVEIHPGLAFETKYNSNVFFNRVAVDDFIYTVAPSLTIEQKREKGDNFGFLFEYLGQEEIYNDLDFLNYYNQFITANLEFGDAGGDLNWFLGGQFLNARLPLSPEFTSTVFNPVQIRTTYDLNSKLLWKITNNIEADIGAEFSHNRFEDGLFANDNQNNYDQYNSINTLIWQTTALTGIGVNYSYQQRDFQETSTVNLDGTMHSGSFIAKWEPLSVFSSEFWIGFNKLNVSADGRQNRDDIIYKAELKYKPNTTSSWTLIGFKEIPFTFWTNNTAFETHAAQLIWNQTLGVKWEASSVISYENRKYDIGVVDVFDGGVLKSRKDDYFSGTVSLTYAIQDWWDVILGYTYANNDSNFENQNYSSNIAHLRFEFVL